MCTRVCSWDIGMRTLSYCILTSPRIGAKIDDVVVERWDCIDILNDSTLDQNTPKKRKRTCKNVSIPDATTLLIQALSRRPFLMDPKPTKILIETQPGGKFANIRMKALSHVLQAFFCIHIPDVHVEFISAKVKLLMKPDNVEEDAVGDSNEARKKRYKSNKEFSTIHCASLIAQSQNPEHAVELFNAYNKKDDLADAFLQGCSIITDAKKRKKLVRTKKEKV